MKKNSPATIACIGALAFIVAGVNHEVIGHGGMSLATGGHVALISAVCGYSLGGVPHGFHWNAILWETKEFLRREFAQMKESGQDEVCAVNQQSLKARLVGLEVR